MVGSEVTITMKGDLPDVAFSKKNKARIENRIKEEVIEGLGEYEIWGEFFGDDPEVYALFLYSVNLEEKTDGEDASEIDTKDATIKDLETRIGSLQSRLEETENELSSYKLRPEKFSLGELNISYGALPFCEGCGENHDEYGVEIEDPTGGVVWCLGCFSSQYDLCEQDIATIEATRQREEKAHYKKKLEG